MKMKLPLQSLIKSFYHSNWLDISFLFFGFINCIFAQMDHASDQNAESHNFLRSLCFILVCQTICDFVGNVLYAIAFQIASDSITHCIHAIFKLLSFILRSTSFNPPSQYSLIILSYLMPIKCTFLH